MRTSSPNFSLADLDDWVAEGILSTDQSRQIRQRIESVGVVQERLQEGKEQRSGLNLVTIAYYFGGFMILFAYSVFVGLRWTSLDAPGQVAISLGTILGLWALGAFLRWRGFTTAGNLLVFAGTAIVPLLVYTLERLVGIFPDLDDMWRLDYSSSVAPAWIGFEVISLVVALVVVWLIRFPLVMLLVAFWSWYLSMDLARWLTQQESWSWGDGERLAGVLVGLILVLSGLVLQFRARRDYSFWLYLGGLLILLTQLGSMALEHEGVWGLMFLGVSLALVLASVFLQRRVFLVCGAIGVYSYLSYLAYRIFADAYGFPLVLAAIGLFIVLSAVGYQKFARPRLERLSQPKPQVDQA